MNEPVHLEQLAETPSKVVSRAAEAPLQERVYVWDLVVRVTHWAVVLSFVLLAVTGFYIGRPFITVAGRATDHFVMGTMKALHYYGAIVFSIAVLSRIAWMFLSKGHASWRSFIPTTRQRLRDLGGTLRFYLFMRDRPPAAVSHNALAGLSYVAVFGLYLVMIITGVALYGIQANVGSWMRPFGQLTILFGGAQGARWIHHVVMWLLIGFAVHHVFSALLMAVTEKNGVLDSIFSGYKWVERDETKKGGEE